MGDIWSIKEHYKRSMGSLWDASGDRGLCIGGAGASNVIDYHAISTTGDFVDFGDLATATRSPASGSSSTRCITLGGDAPSNINVIQYFEMASTGNASDFGDLTAARAGISGNSNHTRLIAGGNDAEETQSFNYNFGNDGELPILSNQLLINSDKITLNARNNNITLSSLVNMDFGAGNNLTINTKNYTSIESSNIYLGRQSKFKKDERQVKKQIRETLAKIKDQTKRLKPVDVNVRDIGSITEEKDKLDGILYKVDDDLANTKTQVKAFALQKKDLNTRISQYEKDNVNIN